MLDRAFLSGVVARVRRGLREAYYLVCPVRVDGRFLSVVFAFPSACMLGWTGYLSSRKDVGSNKARRLSSLSTCRMGSIAGLVVSLFISDRFGFICGVYCSGWTLTSGRALQILVFVGF